MTEQITISLPTAVLQQAQGLAQRMGRSVNEVLSETIELSMLPLDEQAEGRPLGEWSDRQVLAAANLALPAVADHRLSELLDRQQAGQLADVERTELAALMELYQRRLVSKARAIQEAVRRGLVESLAP